MRGSCDSSTSATCRTACCPWSCCSPCRRGCSSTRRCKIGWGYSRRPGGESGRASSQACAGSTRTCRPGPAAWSERRAPRRIPAYLAFPRMPSCPPSCPASCPASCHHRGECRRAGDTLRITAWIAEPESCCPPCRLATLTAATDVPCLRGCAGVHVLFCA